jgi:hypothetical protein
MLDNEDDFFSYAICRNGFVNRLDSRYVGTYKEQCDRDALTNAFEKLTVFGRFSGFFGLKRQERLLCSALLYSGV